MLEITTLILGPAETNCYILADTGSGSAAVIDPAWDGQEIFRAAQKKGWRIEQIWVTHAHFDHIGGVKSLLDAVSNPVTVACNPEDRILWDERGGAPYFGLSIDLPPEPDHWLSQGEILHLGQFEFEVRHVPGHTPGHVVFSCKAEGLLFCGDVIFKGAIGRTDLPGGDTDQLLSSIHSQVLSLPDETRLLPGHGPATTVADERHTNPFLTYLA
jgi:hydroxyacylglutathione hydrolase